MSESTNEKAELTAEERKELRELRIAQIWGRPTIEQLKRLHELSKLWIVQYIPKEETK